MSTAPTVTSSAPLAGAEVCVICGRDPGNAAFCHLYRAGQRIVLCSPQCAETFLERESGEPNGYDESSLAVHEAVAPPGSPADAPPGGAWPS